MKKLLQGAVVVSAFLFAMSASVVAQSSNGPNGNAYGYSVHGNTTGFTKKAIDLGAADPTMVISATVWLTLHNEAQLDQLVRPQPHNGPAKFHNCITHTRSNT